MLKSIFRSPLETPDGFSKNFLRKISKIIGFMLTFASENKCGQIWLLATTQKNAKIHINVLFLCSLRILCNMSEFFICPY